MQVNGRRLGGRRSSGARGRRRDIRAAGPELAQQARREDPARDCSAASARGKQACKGSSGSCAGRGFTAAPADADVPVNPPAAPPSSGHQSDSVTSPGAGSSAPAPATGSPSRTRKWPRRDPRTAGSRSSRHREHRRIGERRRPAPAADEVASSWRDGCGSCQACCRASPPQGLPVPWWPPLTGKCAVNINFKY